MMIDPHRPLSLVEHAAPPRGMSGHAGWVCGFSADGDCMEAFMESFTGLGRRSRADQGRTYICLCLDGSQEQILPGDVPGMLHLPPGRDDPPYRLMHAKVALLAFRDEANPDNWLLRLLVTTGNWTRQTTEDSIDLVWRLDLSSEDLAAEDAVDSLADMAAARDFWRWLRRQYQCGLFDVDEATVSNTQRAPFDELEGWLDGLKTAAGATPRFLDTRDRALVSQLAERVRVRAGSTRRNNLAVGSGFWEGSCGTGLPEVPRRIIAELTDVGLLTRNAEITMVFESENCAALADPGVFDSMKKSKWKLRPPLKQDNRRLHAKFLFSANWKDGSDRCASAWVYLGSGNMTPAGFLLAPGMGGNLEAGIITHADGLQWYENRKSGLTHVGKVLPIDWHGEIEDASALTAGEGPPDRETSFVAAPVSHLVWMTTGPDNALAVPEGQDKPDLEVIGEDGRPLARNGEGRFPWFLEQPAYVGVREGEGGAIVQVPVLDEHGRLAARQLEPIDLEQAIELLARFPAVPEGEPEDDGENGTPPSPPLERGGARSEARYAIRRTMELVEAIAERQTVVPAVDWARWTQRLECVLIQLGSLPRVNRDDVARAGKSALVEAILPLKINPLSCLREQPFLPDHTIPGSAEFMALDAALTAAEANWGVIDFDGFETEADNAQ